MTQMRKSVFTDRNIRKDNEGGIEGLPLQLMILILIATLATAIIIGWMGNIDTPDSIGEVSVDVSSVDAESSSSSSSKSSSYSGYYGSYYSSKNNTNKTTTTTTNSNLYKTIKTGFTVYVTDQDGNPLEGAVVTLSGNGIQTTDGTTPHETTNSNGEVTFTGGTLELKMSGNTAYITIEVSKPGYGEDSTCKLIVIA